MNLELDSDYPDVSHVRQGFPDGSGLYFSAEHISAKVIHLENDAGFSMDNAGEIRFYTLSL